jgi:Peptidase family M1 domain
MMHRYHAVGCASGLKRIAALAVMAWGATLVAEGVDAAGSAGPPPAAPMAHIAQLGDSADGIGFASPRAAAVREPSRADAWGGARNGSEATLSDRVVSYDIAATLDPVRHTIAGSEKLTWRNRSQREVRAIYLHLYLNAFEGSNSTYFSESRNAGFGARADIPIRDGQWGHIELTKVTQGEAAVTGTFVHPDGGPATDHTVVRLDLPSAIAPGASATLQIAFRDQLPRVVARTGYFGSFHLVGQWFPKIGVLELPGERGATQVQWNVHEFHVNSEFYADYGLFDVKLTVPDGYTVGATGEEQGPAIESNGNTTHRFVQGDVHDFAWTADNRTAKPLEGEYRGEGSPVVKVKVLFAPEYAVDAEPVLRATIDALTYFSRTLGPYPYHTVTAVVPPFNAEEAGGMEYPTFFTAMPYLHPDPGTAQGWITDFVTIHEFGHGYFYGILGSNEFEEPMLDEGMNDYWDMRMLRERGELFSLGTRLTKRLGLAPSVSSFDYERVNALRSDPADALGANSWDRLSTRSYASVYSRSATTMHDLEEAVGKESMERALREYYRRWKFRHPSIADLRETLAEVTEQRALVDSVFEQQVYATQKLDDGIELFSSTEELPVPGTSEVNGKWVEFTQSDADKQEKELRKAWEKSHPDAKQGTGPFPYRTSLTLRRRGVAVSQQVLVKFTDGSSQSMTWDSKDRWQRYVWVTPTQAVSAELDPSGKHFLDANILDNSWNIERDRSAARKWTAVLGALAQSFAALVAAL